MRIVEVVAAWGCYTLSITRVLGGGREEEGARANFEKENQEGELKRKERGRGGGRGGEGGRMKGRRGGAAHRRNHFAKG
jgi:hypothetical protein